jgi:hypothetical protein
VGVFPRPPGGAICRSPKRVSVGGRGVAVGVGVGGTGVLVGVGGTGVAVGVRVDVGTAVGDAAGEGNGAVVGGPAGSTLGWQPRTTVKIIRATDHLARGPVKDCCGRSAARKRANKETSRSLTAE